MSNLYDSKPPQPLALKGYPEKTKSYFSGKEKTLKAVLLEFIPIQNMLTCKQQQLNLESSFSTRKNTPAKRKTRAHAGLLRHLASSKGNRSLVRSTGLSKATWENTLLSSQLASECLRCVQHVLPQGVSKKGFQPEREPGLIKLWTVPLPPCKCVRALSLSLSRTSGLVPSENQHSD